MTRRAIPFGTVACLGVVALSLRTFAANNLFEHPPRDSYPQTWFHLIGGNVSKEGLTADLEAIRQAGISGIQFFHGQMGVAEAWPRTNGQIPCLSEKWDDMVRHVASECQRLNLTFEMQNCPGWSMSGGPWVPPGKAMRKLVSFRPERRPAFNVDDDFREIGVVDFPKPMGWDDPLPVPSRVMTNEDASVVFEFSEDITVRSLSLPPPQRVNHEWCYESGWSVELACETEHGRWREVLRRTYPRGGWQDDATVTFCCPATRGRRWRLRVTGKRAVKCLDSVTFSPCSRIEGWEALSGLAYRDLPEMTNVGAGYQFGLGLARLVFGHVNMKMRNGPAPMEATGWECDKLDPSGFPIVFDAYVGRLVSEVLPQGSLKGIVVDSWECGCQNWTEKMEECFLSMNGYALRPHLPELFGYRVDGSDAVCFMRDWRRTVSRLIEENYYRVIAEMSARRGLKVHYETAFGDVIPGDVLRYWRYADVPMCEFWQPADNAKGFVGSDNFKPTRPCVSAAHLYGKNRVAAEALTSFELTYDENFKDFKKAIDRQFARGVTHLVFHTYTHNPQTGDKFLPPGTSFAWKIGSPFLRGQTWWRHMPSFTDYLARCGYMLERGKPVVDVLWYLGDDHPARPDENAAFPVGYKYDYLTQDALLTRLEVRQGMLVLPDGMAYRVIWIPEGTQILPETTRRLALFESQGAKVLRGGMQPDWSADLSSSVPLPEWYHRVDGDSDIYFLSAGADGWSGELKFRNGGSAELSLARDESLFVVVENGQVKFLDPVTGTVREEWRNRCMPTRKSHLDLKPVDQYPEWAVTRDYTGCLIVDQEKEVKAVLQLGDVRDWAEVFVNGRRIASLWCHPYSCDIGSGLKKGENEILVRVTSTWYNRLVHDAGQPELMRETWTIAGPKADAPLVESGLIGPVRLLIR